METPKPMDEVEKKEFCDSFDQRYLALTRAKDICEDKYKRDLVRYSTSGDERCIDFYMKHLVGKIL